MSDVRWIDWLRCLAQSIASRSSSANVEARPENRQRTCVLLMNGPSLARTLADEVIAPDWDVFAVNQFAESEYFSQLRPKTYLIQDAYFWDPDAEARFVDKRDRLFTFLREGVDWPMTLYVPSRCGHRDWLKKQLDNKAITPVFFHSNYLRRRKGSFNAAIEPGRALFALWERGILAPPPENVLVGALYLAARLGYRKLLVVGADFSFFRDLDVDPQSNRVSLEVKHFYGRELRPMHKDKAGGEYSTMAHEMTKWARAFRLFEVMNDYLTAQGVEVFNASDESFIDAFPRIRLH